MQPGYFSRDDFATLSRREMSQKVRSIIWDDAADQHYFGTLGSAMSARNMSQ
jgi:hypothetical protein